MCNQPIVTWYFWLCRFWSRDLPHQNRAFLPTELWCQSVGHVGFKSYRPKAKATCLRPAGESWVQPYKWTLVITSFHYFVMCVKTKQNYIGVTDWSKFRVARWGFLTDLFWSCCSIHFSSIKIPTCKKQNLNNKPIFWSLFSLLLFMKILSFQEALHLIANSYFFPLIFVSLELSSERDYLITHSVHSTVCMYVVCMYVVCMWYFAKLITVSTYIDVFPWDLDTIILG